ncbi:hypothetical protein FHS30_001264 [Simiduia aestuariiviva]|uniref:Uncharacterized protein n=1 Tax=Simiduia aestuariiviva TaxID=1510459 RepID=A0A839UNG8_9GAMM|nr:hypothetical protein [Simiduia aestuariiviva]
MYSIWVFHMGIKWIKIMNLSNAIRDHTLAVESAHP